MGRAERMLIWSVHAIAGFATAWVTIDEDRLSAEPSRRHVPPGYTHVRRLDAGGAVVRYRSGSFQSGLTVDADAFVVDYPQLGRRVEPRSAR